MMAHQRRQFKNEFVLEEAVSDFAEGAEGCVHFCRKKLPDGDLSAERFAAKVFKFNDSDALARMKKQVKAMKAMDHCHILKVHDHFDEEDDGSLYVVMELSMGGELFDHCVNVNGNGPMPEKGLQLVARQLLRGLAHAHMCGIVHLDLKMENILLKNPVTRDDWKDALDKPDAPIQLKIIEWGFCGFIICGGAVDEFDKQWLGKCAPGTEGYRAPETVLKLENVSGVKVSVASDLFSFGCVLYVLACGQPCFRCNNASCRSSGLGCICGGISKKLVALTQGKPEGRWIPLTDPRLKHAQGYSPMLQDLMARLLDPNPETRITAADALRHPWVMGDVSGPASISIVFGDAEKQQLSKACFDGNLQDVEMLLSTYCIDLNAKHDRDQTLLYIACRGARCEPAVVHLLLAHGALPTIPSHRSMSYPGHALVANFAENVSLVNFEDIFSRISEIVRLLREYQYDFSSSNLYGSNPLTDLLHEPQYASARQHARFDAFCRLISIPNVTKFEVEALVPLDQQQHQSVFAAYQLLLKNSKLPEHISASISELVWSDEHSNSWVNLLGMTPELSEQYLLSHHIDSIAFRASTLELKLIADQSPLSLVVCHWPQDFNSNSEQTHVTWQWIAPGFESQCWICITDESLIDQLNQKKSSILFGRHKYTLSHAFFVEPDNSDGQDHGPISGYRIRWIPCHANSFGGVGNCDFGGHHDGADSFQTAFEAALLSNGRPFRFSRLCLIGDGRSGKTALANALCDRVFVETDSTIGVGLNPHLQVTGTGIAAASGNWSVFLEDNVSLAQQQLNWEAAQRLAGEIGSEGDGIHELYVSPTLSSQEPIDLDSPANVTGNTAQAAALSTVSVSLQPLIAPSSRTPHTTTTRHFASSPSIQRTRSHVPIASVAQMDKAMILKLKDQPEPLRINLLDFGGQEAFDHLHHLYVTRASFYLLVFNMASLIGPSSTLQTRQQSIKRLSFWLNSIYLHARGSDKLIQEGFSVAPVILVGTHKDQVPDPKDHESIKQILDLEFDSSPLWRHVIPFHGGTVSTGRGLLNFFPVDNTCKHCEGQPVDDVVRAIQAAVQSSLEEEKYLKAKVPLQWLQVFDALMQEKELDDVPFKYLNDVEQLAADFGLPFCGLSLQEEVVCMLKYFNDLGLLMHHDCPSLRHLVVLDTFRCLVNPASIVMCQHIIHKLPVHLEARKVCGEDYVELTSRGVLNSDLLKVLWKSKDTSSIINEISELMIHYGLMLPLDCAGNKSCTYLVPSLFSESRLAVPSHVCSEFYFAFGTEKRIKLWERSGHFSAHHAAALGFCPNGLFSRFSGNIISEAQRIYNFHDSNYSRHDICTSFGRFKFMTREMQGFNMLHVAVFVETPVALLENLTRLLKVSISELIPNLAFCTAIPMSGCLSDSSSFAEAHFAVLSGANGVLECARQKKDFNSGDGCLLNYAQLQQKFCTWLPPSGLKANYDVFLSYRWTGKIDDDLTEGLFNNLSVDILGSGCGIDVFLDKRRLDYGRNFQDDFANALLNSKLPVIVMSTESLKKMATLEAGSDIDNLFLEWTLILELLELRKINLCLPILIGTYNPSASTCADSISNFFSKKIMSTKLNLSTLHSFPCEVPQQTVDDLPEIVVLSVVAKTRSILGQHGLFESPELSRRTVRDVVKRLSLHLGVSTWELINDSTLTCPASSVKDVVMRTVISHCSTKIRFILDSMQYKSIAVTTTSAAPLASSSVGDAVSVSEGILLDNLARQLLLIGLSKDHTALACMSAKLQDGGVMAVEDLQGLSKEELKEQVAALKLLPVQFSRLFDAVSKL